MHLEDRVCRGGVFYIHSIEHDRDNKRLTLRFLGDPEKDDIVRTLTFTEVEDYVEYWDEEKDPELIESLIGIVEDPQNDSTRYILRLDQFEMHLSSQVEPEVQDLETGPAEQGVAPDANTAGSRFPKSSSSCR